MRNRTNPRIWVASLAGLTLIAWSLVGHSLATTSGLSLVFAAALAATILAALAWHFIRSPRDLLTPGRHTDRIQILQTQALTPRHSIHAIRFDGVDLLVGTADQSITLLQLDQESQAGTRAGASYSDAGVDLADTPRSVEQYGSPAPRSLADGVCEERTALSEANLQAFRAKLEVARQT